MTGATTTPPAEAAREHFGRYLVALGFWPTADEVTRQAADDAFSKHADAGWQRWGEARRAIAAEQLAYRWTGIDVGDVDGLVGPQTQYAREAYAHWREHGELPTWRDAERETGKPPKPSGGIPSVTHHKWPTPSQLSAFYGRPGDEVRSQLVIVECPWELTIAWDTRQKTRRIRIHRECADSLAEVLHAQLEHYGEAGLRDIGVHLYGGSYNHRTMRGGSAWSRHAYGAAIDWDPTHNGLHTRAPQARLSHADAADWWAIWIAAGWRPLGLSWGQDWMHVEATRFR